MKYLKKFETAAQYTAAESGLILPNVSLVTESNVVHYNPYVESPHDYSQDYLTFTATEDGTFKFSGHSINYSIDNGETWTSLASNTDSPTVTSGSKIMWKATILPKSWRGIGTFSSTGNYNAEGNPMSLLYGDNFSGQTSLSGKDYAFYYLFNGCTGMTSVENLSLPATTLAGNCYTGMFNSCTNLTTAPSTLPATTLTTYCYSEMFRGCTSLTTAPELPATTLADVCYYYMFEGCTSLTTAPSLPATTLTNQCYRYMFTNCTSLTTAPELPATTLATSCYDNMFEGCTSLTTVPSNMLPATTLTTYCYSEMFRGCTSLTTAPELPATTLATGCYNSMFYGCTSLTTAPSTLPATTLVYECYYRMFEGCTSLTTAPSLPATTLASGCYKEMFRACVSLNNITCLATDISAVQSTYEWLYNVASSGTFTKAASMSSWSRDASGIPFNWTVVDAS